MKSAIFLFIFAHVLGFYSKTSADTPQQCHQNDPNFNDCLGKLIERGLLVLVNEDPRLNISGTDLYIIEPQVYTTSVENLATGTIILKNGQIKNAGKFKVEDAKIDFDNLVLDVDLLFPKLAVKTEFKIDGKLLEFPLHTAGAFKAEASDVKLHCKVQLRIVERKGVKYLVVDDLEAHESISDGSVNIIVKDPEQQTIVNLIQDWFNENPKDNFQLFDPIVQSEGKLYYLPLVERLWSIIQSDIILSK